MRSRGLTQEGFTCPICGRTSYNPTDIKEGWCVVCQGATAAPPPEGFQWVKLRGGTLDGSGRLIESRFLEEGFTYETILTRESWAWDGQELVLEGAAEA